MKLSLLIEQKHHDIMQTTKMIKTDKAKNILDDIKVKLKITDGEMEDNKAETGFSGKYIKFSNEYKNEVEVDTLIHELGHVFYFRNKLKDKDLKSKDEKVSTYYPNQMERFAENFKFYFLKPNKLKDNVKKELDNLLNNEVKNIIKDIIKSI